MRSNSMYNLTHLSKKNQKYLGASIQLLIFKYISGSTSPSGFPLNDSGKTLIVHFHPVNWYSVGTGNGYSKITFC